MIHGVRQWGITLLYAAIGWGLCGVVMGIGLGLTTEHNATIIHAAAVPFIFWGLSWAYHRRYRQAAPLATAVTFLLFVVLMDVFVVGLAIQGNLRMFGSILGVWIPFLFILLSTYSSGRLAMRHS
jgi:hypothetical protein